MSPAAATAARGGRLATVALVAASGVLLVGCETTQDRSARLQDAAAATNQPGRVDIGRPEGGVRVVGQREVRDDGRTAVVVELENRTDRPLVGVPVGLRVVAGGKERYTNLLDGADDLLLRVPVLAPRSRLAWVNAEVPALPEGTKIDVRVGSAVRRSARIVPRLRVTRLRRDPGPVAEDGQGVSGVVRNEGRRTQLEVPIFLTVHDGARLVAAGNGRIARIPGRSSQPFEATLIGDGRTGRLRAVAVPTKLQPARSAR